MLDFNNDGIQDVLFQNKNTSLVLALGKGNGDFELVNTGISSNHSFVSSRGNIYTPQKIADVNNDGNLDVISIYDRDRSDGELNIVTLLGDGDRTLTLQPDTININLKPDDRPEIFLLRFALHDLNQDGNQDLVITESDYTFPVAGAIIKPRIRLFLGQGDGRFIPWQEVILEGEIGESFEDFTAVVWIKDIKFGDFDEDGDPDIALHAFRPGVTILSLEDFGLLPLQEITATPVIDSISNDESSNLEIADLNHDGHLDFLLRTRTATFNVHTIQAFYGDGALNFTSAQEIGALPPSSNDFYFRMADINQDNEPDILRYENNFLVAGNYSSDILVAYGNPSGIFSEFQVLLEVDNLMSDFLVGDFNQDKGVDIMSIGSPFYYSGSVQRNFNIFYSNNTAIDLSGNSIPITPGDETPDSDDGTAFGAVGLTSSVTRSFSISNSGTVPFIVHRDSVSLENTFNAFSIVDSIFMDSTFRQVFPFTIHPGESETFDIRFSPEALGLQENTVHIKTSACNVKDYQFNISALGVEPSLGIYAPANLAAGGSTTISPGGGVPYASIQAIPPAGFQGTLSVDPQSGLLTVTNPTIPGTYEISLHAFTETLEYEDLGYLGSGVVQVRTLVPNDKTTFELTVLPPDCSDGFFRSGDTIFTKINSHDVHIADFNQDGNLDIINLYSVDIPFPDPDDFPVIPDVTGAAIRLGNGDGTFIGPGLLSETDSLLELIVGFSPRSAAIGDFDGNGSYDISVANSDPVGNLYNRGGIGNGMFNIPELPLGIKSLRGTYSKSIKTADFNQDGFPDVAVANYGLSIFPYLSSVSVLLGDGMLGFKAPCVGGLDVKGCPTILPQVVGNGSGDIVVGDFNEDGNPDYATASFLENKISIRTGDGKGEFSKENDVSAYVGYKPSSIAIGDFNLDGSQDLVTTSSLENTISIKLGAGDGTFLDDKNISYPTGQNPSDVAVADFNGDGIQDLAVTNEDDHMVWIYLGDGQGAFSVNQIVPTGRGPVSLDVGDMNNDGFLDLAVSASQSGFVHLLYGREPITGTLVASGNEQAITPGTNQPGFENHTVFDTLAIERTGSRIYTISNTSPVSIVLDETSISISGPDQDLFSLDTIYPIVIESGASHSFEVIFSPQTAGTKRAVINVDNIVCDGPVHYLDFSIQGTAVLPATIGIYPNSETRVAGETVIIPYQAPTLSTRMTAVSESNLFGGVLTVDPVTGEVFVSNAQNPGTYTIRVYAFNQYNISTSGTFELTVPDQACSIGSFEQVNALTSGSSKTNELVVGDLNLDGFQDMVILSSGLENNSGSFTQQVHLGTDEPTTFNLLESSEDERAIAAVLVDFNGDGIPDIAKLYPGSELVSIELGVGDGTFVPHASYPSGKEPQSLMTGDLDADGNTDIILYNKDFESGISILRSLGKGNFTTHPAPILSGVGNIQVGDFNADGHQDILAFMAARLLLLPGDGSGYFDDPVSSLINAINSPFSFFQTSRISSTKGDFNEDQITDIAYSNDGQGWIHLGKEGGKFDRGRRFDRFQGAEELISGDFNGDGYLDIAVGSLSSRDFYRGIYLEMGEGNGTFRPGKSLLSGEYALGALASGDFNRDGRMDLTFSAPEAFVYWNASAISIQSFNETISAISDNNASPSVANQTDFGTACIGTVVKNLFFLRNNQNEAIELTADDFSIMGADNDHFMIGDISLPYTLGPDSVLAFTLAFAPVSAGVKEATVHIQSEDCLDMDYDFKIQGVGVNSDPLTQAVLGVYASASVVSGQNMELAPDRQPERTMRIHALSNPSSSGAITVDPTTGIIQITNAAQPGMYEITLFASGEMPCDLNTTTFSLEVLATECSNAAFEELAILHPAENPMPGIFYQSVLSMDVGDFNNDGFSDLAGTRYQDTSVIIYLGSEEVLFKDSIILPLQSFPNTVHPADFNGDGNLDMAVSYGLGTNNFISLELGDGNGHFTQSYVSETQYILSDLSVGDFNSDGIPDLLVCGSLDVEGYDDFGFEILFGDGQGGIAKTSVGSPGFQTGFSVLGDLNNDGYLDAVIDDNSFLIESDGAQKSISILLGDGAGVLQEVHQLEVQRNPVAMELSDLNNDGLLDIVVGSNTTGYSWVTIYLTTGEGTYQRAEDLGPFYSVRQMDVSDYNGDGIPDILVVNSLDAEIIVLTGAGDGSFTEAARSRSPGQFNSLVTADFNRDGLIDLAMADTWVNNIVIQGGIDCGSVVGVEDQLDAEDELDFVLYPNPANAFATLQWAGSEYIGEVSLTVFDLAGRKLLHYPTIRSFDGGNTFEVDIQNLEAGVFIFKIETQGAVSSKMLIKQ